jgi:hypothetical protein
MKLTVRREETIEHKELKAAGRTKLVQALIDQLVRLGWEPWLARNVAWWRYRNGRSLVVRKVLP